MPLAASSRGAKMRGEVSLAGPQEPATRIDGPFDVSFRPLVRPLVEADLPEVMRWLADPEVAAAREDYLALRQRRQRASAERRLLRME
jgi:hypothetical protein